jgi:hypothetical protein
VSQPAEHFMELFDDQPALVEDWRAGLPRSGLTS